jgi:uncharacterized protein (DUF58 family)
LRWRQLEVPPVWIRFLLALAGLALAFAAALFSTVTRESGNFWATLVLASFALVLVALVGLTTLPHLARRALGARLRESFDYQVTRAGIVYVLVVLLIGIAALNTGNNLLYVIVAAMIAAILVSGLASGAMLRGLALDVHIPERVFAGQTAPATIVLDNRRRWVPAFSVSVRPIEDHPLDRGARWLGLDGSRSRRALSGMRSETGTAVPVEAKPAGLLEQSTYFPYLPAAHKLQVGLELRFPRRGRYRQQWLGLTTGFPFAFLRKTRRVSIAREVLAYPKISSADAFSPVLSPLRGDFEAFVQGRGPELYRIREYLPPDSIRHVDWKATAKSGALKVREFSREDERRLRIWFDNPPLGMLSFEAYENAVEVAASLAWHLAREEGTLRFAVSGGPTTPDLYDFLAQLAVIEPAPQAALLAGWPLPGREFNIVVSARPPASLARELPEGFSIVFVGASGGDPAGPLARPQL